MASVVKCIGISGITGYPVDVEVKIMGGATFMSIVGLGDQAVKEAKDRIESVFDQIGATFPKKKTVVNLSPSDIKKSGTHFDLPMVMGMLLESGQVDCQIGDLDETVFMGEIGLAGDLKHFNGVLPMVIAAKQSGFKRVIIPRKSMEEAHLVNGIEVVGCDSLEMVVKWIEKRMIYSADMPVNTVKGTSNTQLDFKDVKGHVHIMRYVTVAAAGGHNMLLIGPPGCGKSMIAKRFPSILPELSQEELLEVMSIQSISGELHHGKISTSRPFRAPHYNTSANAIIGGGSNATPGEISLAHNGILFLDELPEFGRQTLEALRQPLEDRVVTVARVKQTNTFPANFMLIAAMNPCPCGYSGEDRCRCSDYEKRRYRQKISGPILERIDIQKALGKVEFMSNEEVPSMTSAEIKDKVMQARHIQYCRFKDINHIRMNAEMDASAVLEFCKLDTESQEVMQKAYERHGFSARAYHKVLKIARTFADLDASQEIKRKHMVFALMARDVDRQHEDPYVYKREEWI